MKRRDKIWVCLMVVGIIVAYRVPRPLDIIQAALCGWSIGIRWAERR